MDGALDSHRNYVFFLAFGAPAANATPPRSYESQILSPGTSEPLAIAADAADHVWVSYSTPHEGIAEYAAFPSLAQIGDLNGEGYLEGRPPGFLAIDSINGSIYSSDPLFGRVDEFTSTGELTPPQWEFGSFGVQGLSVDNSGDESNGTVYVVNGSGNDQDSSVKAFNPGEVPAAFAAHEPYIDGNEIDIREVSTGQEPLESVTAAAVDSSGNLYLADPLFDSGSGALAEFSHTGEFLRLITFAEVPGGLGERGLSGLTIDPSNGNILVVDSAQDVVDELSTAGKYLGQLTGTPTGENGKEVPFGKLTGAIAVNSAGVLYIGDAEHATVDIFAPTVAVPRVTYNPESDATPTSGTLNATVDPQEGGNVTACHFEYGTDTSFGLGSRPCLDETDAEIGTASHPITTETEVHTSLSGLSTDTTYYYRLVAGNSNASRPGLIRSFTPRAVQNLQTDSATNVEATSATLNGSFFGEGENIEYFFQYGSDSTYGNTTSETRETGPLVGAQELTGIPINGLQLGATYHYRIVARDGHGTTFGPDRTVTTLTRPSIDGLSTSNLTSTAATLHATINPNGGDTKYHFEYGTTAAYGNNAPEPAQEIADELSSDHAVQIAVGGLQPNVTYHFRVVAESKFGSTESEDQTFSFHPPNCPNAHLRQITNSSKLPDCRAYELVSPEDAGGATLFPEGPNSQFATNPARLAFGGFVDAIPGTGNPPNTLGDLYVATRTDEGWSTKYVGMSGNETFADNGPPDEARSTRGVLLGSPGGNRTDTSMNKFLNWNDGIIGFTGPKLFPPLFTPHVWSAEGTALETWPTIPGYSLDAIFEQSADFSHFVFQVGSTPSFSLIDDDTATNAGSEVSKDEAGDPIPIQPGDSTPDEESLRPAAVSTDGSHILIASRTEAAVHPELEDAREPCGLEKTVEQFQRRGEVESLCPLQTSQLYMRVDDAITYEIAPGHGVTYVGMTPDGSKVFFLSAEHLTNENLDHSGASLYMWSAEKAEKAEPPIALISKGDNPGGAGEPGNTGECSAVWTTGCGIVPFVNNSYYEPSVSGYIGGSGLSDNSIAATSGDIYFFSPEQLAGAKGIKDQENLYDFRNGAVQYVATFPPISFCNQSLGYCSAGPVIRMQVTPSDGRMAFLTASRVTSYKSAGHTEMYIYDPAAQEVKCISCLPSGTSPASDVYASSDGLFMADDGRAFFSTADPLVPEDTDGLRDVYEYVEGHAQLISSGTSAKDANPNVLLHTNPELFTSGLVGVSAEGTNAYFTTYDSLVGQDRNGSQLKFYDARTDGGFPYLAPPAPCEAADECHGESSVRESPTHNGAGAELGLGGNMPQTSHFGKRHRRAKRHRRSRHHRSARKSRTQRNGGGLHG